jgi:hypothetical protein
MNFLQNRALPLHHLCQAQSTVLHDEDIAGEIRTQIIEKSKKGFVKAEDFINLIVRKEFARCQSQKNSNPLAVKAQLVIPRDLEQDVY